MLIAAATGVAALATGTSRAADHKPDQYGYTFEELTEAEKAKFKAKLTDMDLPFELLGGEIVFHGVVHVREPNEKTTAEGKVSKGPEGGPFHGSFRVDKEDPMVAMYDDDDRPRQRLQIFLDLDRNYLVWRRCYRRILLGGWKCGPWHVLKAW
jgi:hypothetical protein